MREDEVAASTEVQNPFRIPHCIEGSRGAKEMLFLPGEDPLICELWNYAMRLAKRAGDGPLCIKGLQTKP